MPFIPNTEEQIQEMLKECNVKTFEELLSTIPKKFLHLEKCCLPDALSELEVTRKMNQMALKNIANYNSFLGAGVYDHFIPAAVDHIIIRPEFLTAYTPYQAEVSQGTLQYIYEYQSLICEMTGAEIANAGMYDGASAAAEAILMAVRHTKKNKALICGTVHPLFQKVIKAYTEGINIELIYLPEKDGRVDMDALKKEMNEDVAGVLLQTPNFYGNIEDAFAVEEIVHHSKKTLFIVAVDPISIAVMNAPLEYKADIVIGEGQALGNAMNFGGPLFGFFATSMKLARIMPGRVVGATIDADGKTAYSLTLQAREQHIRRGKATSNICSSDQLCSLAACVYMTLMGPEGLREVAEHSTTKAHYLAEKIAALDGFEMAFHQPFFKEFVIKTPVPAKEIVEKLMEKKIFAGVPLSRFDMDENLLLIAVTEKKQRTELDALVDALKEVNNG
jgi:glycine dehydrogenase subunit 1